MNCRLSLFLLLMFLVLLSDARAVTLRDVVYSTKHAGKVVFSHTDHIGRKGLSNNCRVCHDAIFDLKKKSHVSMADMGKGTSCGACHNAGAAFSLKECARCHQTREKVYKVTATGPTRFSHASHLAKTTDCGVCHPAIFSAGPNKRSTMAAMEKGKSCGACHNGKKTFGVEACVTCHPVREITWQIKATGPTHFSHTTHLQAIKCGACHPKLYAANSKNRRTGMAAMEKGASCGACHNAKQAFSIKECSQCHPVRELMFEEKEAGNAVFSHKFHTGLYTCSDCHPSLYPTTRSTVKVSMQEMEKGKSCGSCHEGKTAFSVKEKCEACHKM